MKGFKKTMAMGLVLLMALTSILPSFMNSGKVEAANSNVLYKFTRVTSFTAGQTYIFIPDSLGVTVNDKDCLMALPTGTGTLRAKNETNGASYYVSNYGYHLDIYVTVVEKGTGFDHCPEGAFANYGTRYFCYAGGVQNLAGKMYTYSTATVSDSNLSATLKGNVEERAKTGKVTITKNDVDVALGINGTPYGVADYEITDAVLDLQKGDNTISIRYGNTVSTVKVKLDASVSKAPTAKSGLIYNGNAQTLINAGTASGGTMYYAVGGNTAPTSGWSTSLPSKAEPGTHNVWYYVKGDADHNDSTPAKVSVSIDKAGISPQVNMNGWTWEQAANSPSVSGNTGNAAVSFTYSTAAGGPFVAERPSIPGTYYVKADIPATNYYKAGSSVTSFTINKANITPQVSISGWTYGEEANEPFISGNKGNGTVTYSYSSSENGIYVNEAPTNAGNYFVKAEVGATSCYNSASCVTPFTVEKADIRITADDKVSTYKTETQELTYTISGDYIEGDDLGVELFADVDNKTRVGEYDIEVAWNENSNYDAEIENGKYTVTKADMEASISGFTGVYDGEAHSSLVDVGDTDAIVYYSTSVELTEDNFKEEGSTEVPEFTKAGTTTVYYYIYTGNYDPQPVTGSFTVEIQKAETTTVVPPVAKPGLVATEVGQPLITVGDVEGGEIVYAITTENVAPSADAYTKEVPTATEPGTYYVWYMVLGDENHDNSEPACIEVTVAAVPVIGTVSGRDGGVDTETLKSNNTDTVIQSGSACDIIGLTVDEMIDALAAEDSSTKQTLVETAQNSGNLGLVVKNVDATKVSASVDKTAVLMSVLTGQEMVDALTGNDNIKLTLQIAQSDYAKIGEHIKNGIKTKAEEKFNGNVVVYYMDVDMFMKRNNEAKEQLTEFGEKNIDIAINLPAKIKDKYLQLVRTHDEKDGTLSVDALSDGDGVDETYTISTNKLCVMGLAYKTSPKATATAAPAAIVALAPKTGESNTLVIFMICLAVLTIAGVASIEANKTK